MGSSLYFVLFSPLLPFMKNIILLKAIVFWSLTFRIKMTCNIEKQLSGKFITISLYVNINWINFPQLIISKLSSNNHYPLFSILLMQMIIQLIKKKLSRGQKQHNSKSKWFSVRLEVWPWDVDFKNKNKTLSFFLYLGLLVSLYFSLSVFNP